MLLYRKCDISFVYVLRHKQLESIEKNQETAKAKKARLLLCIVKLHPSLSSHHLLSFSGWWNSISTLDDNNNNSKQHLVNKQVASPWALLYGIEGREGICKPLNSVSPSGNPGNEQSFPSLSHHSSRAIEKSYQNPDGSYSSAWQTH